MDYYLHRMLTPSTRCHGNNSVLWKKPAKIGCHRNLPSINPASLAKIGPADFKIIGLTQIFKNIF